MDRQGISPLVYNNNDEFDATNNNFNDKMDDKMEEIKSLIKAYKRSSSSLRRRSRAHPSELPSPARSHRHRHHHQLEREGQEINTNNRSTTSPSTLASSPSDFKASSPLDTRHLCRQSPQDYAQEKLPKLKSATSRATTATSTLTMRFLSMGLKTPRSISSGSARWTPTSSYIKYPPEIK